MRCYSCNEKIILEIVTDLHIFSTREYEKLIFGMPYVV
jgi:hypothetical protein